MDENFRERFRRDDLELPVRVRQTSRVVQSNPLPKVSNRKKRQFKSRRVIISTVIAVFVLVGCAGYFIWRVSKSKPVAAAQSQHYFPANITSAQINIPVYYPVGLPSGYAVGSFSMIQKNVLYYAVTDSNGNKFYITIQPLPVTFNFVTFAEKFPQPDQYQTPIGSDLVGVAGSNLIGSVQTNQNVWILLNSSATTSKDSMETITRALRQVSL